MRRAETRRECSDKDTKMLDAGEAAGRGCGGRMCGGALRDPVHSLPPGVSSFLRRPSFMPATPLITLMYRSSLGSGEKQHDWITCWLVCVCVTANTQINSSSPQERLFETVGLCNVC